MIGPAERPIATGPADAARPRLYPPPMDLPTLQIILQSISSSAIAASFVFAAVQFRAYRQAQHVANFSKLVELQMQLRRMRVDDPSLASVYRDDVEGLESDRDIREYFFNLMQLSVFEIAWFSYKNGQIPEDYFKSWDTRMQIVAAEPSFRRMMDRRAMKFLHDDFQRYMYEHYKPPPREHVPGEQPPAVPAGSAKA